MQTVSVGIVTFNNADKICTLLESIYDKTVGVKPVVYVIDNNSTDNTVALVKERFPMVAVVEQTHNGGFGHGHNAVINLLESDFHAVVNPDIIFQNDALTLLTEFLISKNDVAAVTPLVLEENGDIQYLPRRKPQVKYLLGGKFYKLGGPFTRWRDEYTMKADSFDTPVSIEFCTGCFTMMRTALFKELGGFDERFFMYFEDADLSRSALEHGGLFVVPDARVVHGWERASAKNLRFFIIQVQSMLKYFHKWH